MASQAMTSAGSKIYVSATAPTTYDLSGFTALTWTEIGEVTDLGELGREYTKVEHKPLGDRKTVKRKGSYDDGAIDLEMALASSSDAGQTLLKAASISDSSYSYKIVLQNSDAMYFSAQCMSFKISVGSVDDITSATCTLELTENIIEST